MVVRGGRGAGPLYRGGPPLSWPIVVVCASCGVVLVWRCHRLRRLIMIVHCFRLRVVVVHRRCKWSWVWSSVVVVASCGVLLVWHRRRRLVVLTMVRRFVFTSRWSIIVVVHRGHG